MPSATQTLLSFSRLCPEPRRRARRYARRPQLESNTPLVAIAIARQVLEEASLFLGVSLPSRYAAYLAHRARRIYAHSAAWRRRLAAEADAGCDRLHVFMRHWLAARLQEERPDLFARLPRRYSVGEPLPSRPPSAHLLDDRNPTATAILSRDAVCTS
jgi:hypothetical protein